MAKLPLIGISGRGRSYTQNHRRALNLIVEADDAGGKSKLVWIGRPGLKAFGTPTAVVRGPPVAFGDYIYYVAADKLYRMDSAGTESSALGTLTTNSGNNVSIVKNRHQLLIVDGTQEVFVYYVLAYGGVAAGTFTTMDSFSLEYSVSGVANISGTTYEVTTTTDHTGAIGEEALISGTTNFNGTVTITAAPTATTFRFTHSNGTDADETGLTDATAQIREDTLTISPTQATHMNGYGVMNNSRVNNGDGVHAGQFYITSADDFSNIDASDVLSAQRNPDDLKALYAIGGDLHLFGEESLEHYYYAGAVDAPFQPTQAAATPWGIEAPWSVAKVGDGVAWVAQRDNGGRSVALMEGYIPRVISSHAVAYRLSQATAAQIAAATAFSYREEDHDLYVLTFGTETWVYDHKESERLGAPAWTEWSTNSAQFLGKFYVRAFGKHLVTHHTSARIVEMDMATYTDEDAGTSRSISRLGVSAYIHADDKSFSTHRLSVLLESGVELLLESSDDNGTTWTSHGTRSGRHQEWHGLGLAETDRLYRISTSDAAKVVVVDAYIDSEPGAS